MVEIMVIALYHYLSCVCVSYCLTGFYFITKGKDTTLSEKLCICLLVPFYPIIFRFSFHIFFIVKLWWRETLEKEEETTIEVVMMVSKKELIK